MKYCVFLQNIGEMNLMQSLRDMLQQSGGMNFMKYCVFLQNIGVFLFCLMLIRGKGEVSI